MLRWKILDEEIGKVSSLKYLKGDNPIPGWTLM